MRSTPRIGIFILFLTTVFAGLPCPAQNPPDATSRRDGLPPTNRAGLRDAMDRALRADQELQAQRSTGWLPANLRATIYEVQATAAQLQALDTGGLTGKTEDAVLGLLQQTGRTRLIYEVDQPINVFYGRITVGSQDPVATKMNVTTNGALADGISYQNTGAVLQFSASNPTNDVNTNPVVSLTARVSGFAPGDLTTPGFNGNGAVPRAAVFEDSAPLVFGRARLLTGVISRNTHGNEVAPTLYVVRYTFDKFSPAAPADSTGTNAVSQNAAMTNSSARFQATVYELDAIPTRVATLNAAALVKHADTADNLLQTLNENGKARVLQQIDKTVNLRTDKIQFGGNDVVAVRARLAGDGRILFTRQAMRNGVTFDFAAHTVPAGSIGQGPTETTAFSFSGLVPGELDLAPGIPATAPHLFSSEDTEPVQFNQPRVFFAVRSVYAREQETPVVYVVRYLYTPLVP